jgi:hypothetical protein
VGGELVSTFTRRDDADGVGYEPVDPRWDGNTELSRVASPQAPQVYSQDQESVLTWPTAIFNGQARPVDHGMLTMNALLAPDLPRPALPDWTQWPNRLHIWPAAAAIPWSLLGFWAHSEPMHAWFAAGFLTAGVGLIGLGALGTAAGNTVAREADSEPADRAATRGLMAAGLASVSGAAATGGGFSGIGCMLAAGTLAAGYGGYFGWRRHNRNQAIQSVIAYAAASNPGSLPPGMPLPRMALPSITSPFETRILNGLEEMRVTGAWVGPPRRIADDVHSLPFELSAGASMSPEALAKKEAVLANNIRARRVEIEPTFGARGVFTIYDGPDRTDENYEWDGTMVASVEKPFIIAYDDAGRRGEIDLTEHILGTGKTRMGKSALTRTILCSTLEAPMVRIGVDCKDGAPGLGLFEPVMHKLATDPLDGMRIQFGIKAIASARGKLMREKGLDEWDLRDGPRVLVTIDERAELTRRFPQAAKILESNLQLVAAAKITYLDDTQTPSSPVFGKNTDARHQYGIRLGFHNESTANQMLFGGKASTDGWRLERLDGVGKFLMSSLNHRRPRVYKALWTPRDVAVELVDKYADQVQQLDTLSAEAFEAGMAAFDEAMAAGLDPFEAFEPPPGGGGGRDAIDEADDFHNGRVVLSLVPTYPNSNEAIERKEQPLWNLLGGYGSKGAFATDLAAEGLENYKSESNVRKQLNVWAKRGYVTPEKDGRAERFARVDKQDRTDRREA